MFTPDWLALREPADAAARSARLVGLVAEAAAHDAALAVVDLGAGSGSNLRYLAPWLPSPQRWRLIDHDPALLDVVPAQLTAWSRANGWSLSADGAGLLIRGETFACHVDVETADLACDAAALAGPGLVTASALLDLVSEPWLRRLAESCRDRGATVLFALTYDGRIRCSPEEPEDRLVQELVNRHQRTDKGFGPALGPEAAEAAPRCFERVGYHVAREASDWVLSPASGALQRQLIDGWAGAASATDPGRRGLIAGWRTRRLAHVLDGRSELAVGHQDLAGLLHS